MAEQVSELGRWVVDLSKAIYFQPDDECARIRMQDSLSPELGVRINGRHLTGDQWKTSISQGRANKIFTIQSCREILSSEVGGSDFGGSVAHLTTFVVTEKQTGIEKKKSTVTVATVATKDGQRVLTELTEVQGPLE